MKLTHLLLSACCLAAVSTGCKSIKVEKYPDQVATNPKTGEILLDADGKPVTLGGWHVKYFQHWNWQKFDSMHAKAGPDVELKINGYTSGADSNIVALVSTSLDGAARITEKIVAAIISGGGSVAAEGGSAAIVALANKFIAAGGDETKASVTCKDGSCTVTDGCVTCTESGCIDCKSTAQ